MKKFLLGILAGLIIAGVSSVVLFFAALKFARRQPEPPKAAFLSLRLEGDLPEAAPATLPLPAFESRSPMTVAEVWSALRRASTDPRIKGVILKPRSLSAGWAKLEELRSGIELVRKSGKPVYAWLASPGTREYYLASAADRVFLSPEDLLDLKGMRIEAQYFKGALDKLGVEVEVEHVGKYKDAGDTFSRTSMSPESREALGAILDERFSNLCRTIGAARKISPEKVRSLIDDGPFLAPKAVAAGLIDALDYEREADRQLALKAGADPADSITARAYLNSLPDPSGKKVRRVAYLVAQGDILRAGAPSSLLGDDRAITPHAIQRQLRLIAGDPSIRGAILRIDSPGGDAIASDEILAELKSFSSKKPLVISMSDVAASGGYYIAMTGDPVVAYPGTITGSIGVIYGKVNLSGLYAKLGIGTEILKRGRFADIDSGSAPLTPEGRVKLRESLQFIYDGFIKRVADGRKRPAAQIEPLAQGRVWIGAHARQNGLIDELGGLDRAVALLKTKAKIADDESVRLVQFPGRRSLLEELMRSNPLDESSQQDSEIRLLLRHLPPGTAPWLAGGTLRVLPYTLRFN